MTDESTTFEQYVAEPLERLLWFVLKFIVEIGILVALGIGIGVGLHSFLAVPDAIRDHELLRGALDIGFMALFVAFGWCWWLPKSRFDDYTSTKIIYLPR